MDECRGFRELVCAYPRTERAIGFLQGMSAGARLGITGTDGPEDDGERELG